MLHATQPLYPPAGDATGVPMYGAPPPATMGAPVPPAAYGAPVPPAPAPVPAAPVSSAAADLDAIFGFTPSNPPAPAAATAPAPPAAAPVYGAPYGATAPPTATPLPGVAPPAAPAAAAAFPATAGAPPPAGFPAYAPPPTTAPYAPPPAATPGVPGVPAPAPGALPSALPTYGTPAPGAAAPGAYPAAPPVEPLAAPMPGMPPPGGLPGAGALPSALPGVAAMPVPGALPGALPAAPLGGVPAPLGGAPVPLGGAYGGVGGLPPAPGGLGAARPAGYTDPLALGLQDMTLDNSLSESERRQKESQRKIQELKDSIASFKKQNETAAAEREAKTSGLQRDFGSSAAAPSHVQPQQPPQQQYREPPQMERYTGSSADLKADLSRQFSGADDSVIADLVENVVQGHMSRAQAMEMLGEMCGTACNQATELSRRDEEYARMLQAQEEREVTMQRPASKTLGYEGLGNVSRLEQEQRDMDLAKQMQEKENLASRASEQDERPRGGSQFRGQHGGGGGGGGPPLPTHVSIPTFESRDGATFFLIEVILDNDDHYKVSKRYSQFDQLRQRVEASPFGKGGPAFPPKALTSSVATNEQRRHTLASWLQDMVERSQRAHVGDLREAIGGFLEISSRRGAAGGPSSRGW